MQAAPTTSSVATRVAYIKDLITVLKATKQAQDFSAQPTKGRGVWLNSNVWQAVNRQLEGQIRELLGWEQLLRDCQEELSDVRQRAVEAQAAACQREEALQANVARLHATLAEREALLTSREAAWETHKGDLAKQADHLMGLVHESHGALVDNEALSLKLNDAHQAKVQAERRALEAEGRCEALQKELDYFLVKSKGSITDRDAQAFRVRDLTIALQESRHNAEHYRQALQARSTPSADLLRDITTLKADNCRLLALLGAVPEYRALAHEVATQGGLHYLPLQDCLLLQGVVQDVYPPLQDRPVCDIKDTAARRRRANSLTAAGPGPGAAAGPGEGESSGGGGGGGGSLLDGPGPGELQAVVMGEAWAWVPRQAIELGFQLLRRELPAMPVPHLLNLVAELNKVWRQRESAKLATMEARHKAQMAQVMKDYQQRAPYESVVTQSQVNHLRRQLRLQAAHARALHATNHHAAAAQQQDADSKVLLHVGLASINELTQQLKGLTAKNKKLTKKVAVHKSKSRSAPAPVCSSCLDAALAPSSAATAAYLGRALGWPLPHAAAGAGAGAGGTAPSVSSRQGEEAAAAAAGPAAPAPALPLPVTHAGVMASAPGTTAPLPQQVQVRVHAGGEATGSGSAQPVAFGAAASHAGAGAVGGGVMGEGSAPAHTQLQAPGAGPPGGSSSPLKLPLTLTLKFPRQDMPWTTAQ